MRIFLILVLLGLCPLPSGAQDSAQLRPAPKLKDIELALISTDYTSKTYTLMIQVDQNKNARITGIKTRNNKKNKVKFYPTKVLGSEMTLVKAAGIKLITLRCLGFLPNIGCGVIIEYPSNIVLASFNKFIAELKRDPSGKWHLYHHNRPFTKLFLKARKAAGILVGIKEIVPSAN